MFRMLSQVLGGLAVLVSLSFVACELKRNNHIAVVQSQYELVSLQNDLRAMLAEPNVLRVVMTRDVETLTEEEDLLFRSSIMGWFDLFELVFLAAEQGVLSDEQFEAWKKGVCEVPDHWLEEFVTTINQGNHMAPVAEGVKDCLDQARQTAN